MVKKLRKTSIIGSGNVGSNAALILGAMGVTDIVLVDIAEGLAQGRALDISQALAILGKEPKVTGADYEGIAGSDIVVITAGLPRRPGMTRTDLLEKNGAIIKAAAGQIKQHAPEAIVMVVTNPLDAMTRLAWRETGKKATEVIGMGGLLDSGRFTHFLTEAFGVSRAATEAVVIGAHGDEMVPVTSAAAAGGVPFSGFDRPELLAEAAEKARHGGAEIVGYLKKGSASYGPGAAISLMVKSILLDEKRIFSACVYAGGQYGLDDIYINLPAVLGAGGVEKILELPLSEKEKQDLHHSAAAVRQIAKGIE